MMSAATSKNDMDRWGMFPFRASPRQADVLIVAGTLTTKMAGPLVRLWEQMPEPKWCVALGDCTCSGGRYKRSYSTVEGIDRVMPVDVYVPGCPPRPEGLIYGMMKLQQLVKDRRGHWPRAGDRPDRPGRTSERWIASCERAPGGPLRATQLTGPVRQRHDETEIRIAAGDVVAGPDRAARRAGARLRVPGRPRRRRHRRRRCRSSTTSGARRRRTGCGSIADGLSRDDPRVPSVTFLWKGAEWMEREAYDMFGITFEGNRDLRRIYMPPDYQSFPLRKDFYLADDAARSPGGGVRHDGADPHARSTADRRRSCAGTVTA